MTRYLAVDIGGTQTRLELSNASGEILAYTEKDSDAYASFDDLLREFLQESGVTACIDSACFAVAGPVVAGHAQVTNLPWKLDRHQLMTQFNLRRLVLCNDFAAVGHGLGRLTDEDWLTLQAGQPVADAPRAVIGAGTGLGQAIILPQEGQWQVMATEGGHVDFAPTTALQIALLGYLQRRYDHVSYERIISGPGLVAIYQFLQSIQPEVSALSDARLDAAMISQLAHQEPSSLAAQALDLFMQIYGAQAGNLALLTIPRSGLFIAGGIAAKNRRFLKKGLFMQAFNAKGKMAKLVNTIPVYLIIQPNVGLLGARHIALQQMGE